LLIKSTKRNQMSIKNRFNEETTLLFQKNFHQIFSKTYNPRRAKPVEKCTLELFSAIHVQTIERVQTVVSRLKSENKINTCVILGRARLVAQTFENHATDPAKKAAYQEKKVFLLKSLEDILKSARKDKTTFFRELYSGRLKYRAPCRKVATPTGKAQTLLFLMATICLVSHVAAHRVFQGTPGNDVSFPANAFERHLPGTMCLSIQAEEKLKSMNENLVTWNKELDSQI
jgi:hypothetical protein